MRGQVLALRKESPSGKIAEAPVVRSVDEPCLCEESWRNVLVHGVEFQVARTALGKDLVCRTGQMSSVTEFGFAGHGLRVHLPVLAELHLRIKSAHAVETRVAEVAGAE